MTYKNLISKILILCLGFFSAHLSWAWGGRGHAAICSAAIHLVKNQQLKDFLSPRPHTMAHLCNIPDIYWKSLGGAFNKVGDPTHFLDPEVIGLKPAEIPLNFEDLMKQYTGTENKFKPGPKIFSVPTELGSIWWRADQFVRRIEQTKSQFATATPPGNGREQQDENSLYNQLVYQMMVNMGLMGHFVGDASQPLHTSADYDGWYSGHGGLHAYYEEAIVAYFGPDLENRIVTAALSLKGQKFLTEKSALEKMRSFTADSHEALKDLYAADPLVKKSELRLEKGMELKTPAVRKPPQEGFKSLEKQAIKDLARGALALAHFWDLSYELAGKPNLSFYRWYKYPFTPEFVEPDYAGDEGKVKSLK